MAAGLKFNAFVQTMATAGGAGGMNLATDALKVMLTNTAPIATNSLYGDISGTEIAGGGTTGYTVGGATVTTISCTQTAGTLSLLGSLAAPTWTAGASGMGPFRYLVIYDSTATVPLKPLIGAWDYGSNLTLTVGQTFTASIPSGILSLT